MTKEDIGKFSPEGRLSAGFLEQLKRRTLIQSTAASLRLSGINVTDTEVERIVHGSMVNSVLHCNLNKTLSVKQLAVWRYLEKVDEATPREIAEYANVARPTVNQALEKFLRLKRIERIGLGRSTRYRKL